MGGANCLLFVLRGDFDRLADEWQLLARDHVVFYGAVDGCEWTGCALNKPNTKRALFQGCAHVDTHVIYPPFQWLLLFLCFSILTLHMKTHFQTASHLRE